MHGLSTNSSFAVHWYYSRSQNYVRRGWSLETVVPSSIQLIAMKYFEDPLLGQIQFSCYITSASSRLFAQLQLWHLHWQVWVQSVADLHSCMSLRCYTPSLWETLLQSEKIPWRLDDVSQDNSAAVPALIWQVPRVKSISECFRVGIPSLDQNKHLLYTVCLDFTNNI